MEGTTFRVQVIARTYKDSKDLGSVVFNLFAFDTPEDSDQLVCSCGNVVMETAHFKTFLKALRTNDVSTNVEMHDRFVERGPCGKEGG